MCEEKDPLTGMTVERMGALFPTGHHNRLERVKQEGILPGRWRGVCDYLARVGTLMASGAEGTAQLRLNGIALALALFDYRIELLKACKRHRPLADMHHRGFDRSSPDYIGDDLPIAAYGWRVRALGITLANAYKAWRSEYETYLYVCGDKDVAGEMVVFPTLMEILSLNGTKAEVERYIDLITDEPTA